MKDEVNKAGRSVSRMDTYKASAGRALYVGYVRVCTPSHDRIRYRTGTYYSTVPTCTGTVPVDCVSTSSS